MGRRWPNQTRLVEVQRVRDLSRSITQKAHPQTSRVSKTKKQTPSWVVLPPTAPQSPQKENKGKDPGLASAPGEREARGGWRPGPDRTLTQNDHVPPVMRTARGGENTSGLLGLSPSAQGQQQSCGWGQGGILRQSGRDRADIFCELTQ